MIGGFDQCDALLDDEGPRSQYVRNAGLSAARVNGSCCSQGRRRIGEPSQYLLGSLSALSVGAIGVVGVDEERAAQPEMSRALEWIACGGTGSRSVSAAVLKAGRAAAEGASARRRRCRALIPKQPPKPVPDRFGTRLRADTTSARCLTRNVPHGVGPAHTWRRGPARRFLRQAATRIFVFICARQRIRARDVLR